MIELSMKEDSKIGISLVKERIIVLKELGIKKKHLRNVKKG